MISMPDLRATIDGQVIAPEDPEYDEARAVFYGGLDPRPAVIVKVAGADDVARVTAFARETGLELAVRSGGHSGAGHCTTDGGIVLDLSSLKAIDIDARGRTAWAETGLTAGEFSTAVGAHGLALAFGDTGSVGIGGITLGGGIGYLVRKQGLTIDALLAADVVTADGELVRADESTLPDLFWAIRGGGGNFGVATRFYYRLHALPQIVGGMLLLPASADTVAGFIAAAEAAPEELSTIANVIPAPPMPFVPQEHHGKLAIMALMAYAGDAERGAAHDVRGLRRACRRSDDDLVDREAHALVERATGGRAGTGARRRDGSRARGCDRVRASRQPDHGERGRALRGRRGWARARSVGRSVRHGAPPERPRRVRELPRQRGREPDPSGVSGPDVGAARRDQASLRPDQPVPPKSEHRARRALAARDRQEASRWIRRTWTSTARSRSRGRARSSSSTPAPKERTG